METGSRARIWKQDPSVTPIGIRLTYVHSGIQDGPKDHEIEIVGMPQKILGDKNRDFIFDQKINPEAFDAVHTFVVVRQVMTMYQRALRRLGRTEPFTWQWGKEPIKVAPHAGMEKNAFYSREMKTLRFFFFHPNEDASKSLVYTNRSFDIVAHETGHAILDALRPGYWGSWHPQTGGLHESFGDITAILTMLSQMDQCEAIISHSKGDLHVKSFFSAVAEEFGSALYGTSLGLRNADNDLTLNQVSEEVHDISQVFTGAFYDIMADVFEDYRDPDRYDAAETLFRVGKHMTSLLIQSLLKGPEKNATFSDIANIMISLETNKKWKNIIRSQFEVRGVIGKNAVKKVKSPVDLVWSGCHCTMSTKEHIDAVNDAIQAKMSKTCCAKIF